MTLCELCHQEATSATAGYDTQGTVLCSRCASLGPAIEDLVEQERSGRCKALDGCQPVEPDGYCQHGMPSWLRWLGIV